MNPHGLRELLDCGNGGDRAYVDAMIRMSWPRASDPEARAALVDLHRDLRAAAARDHAELRAQISAGALRGAALRARFEAVSAFERDHFVEEVLGIAYPPLDEAVLQNEIITYSPSGYDEIVHALDVSRLGPDDRFLDIGSGMGKVVLLAALLTNATSSGVERDRSLHELADDARRELRVDAARFLNADARDAPLADADVVFMYLPFTGGVLAQVMSRLIERQRRRGAVSRSRRRYLCAGALDTRRYADLAPAGPPKSWLHVYAWE